MKKFTVNAIGYTEVNDEGFFIQLQPEYVAGIQGLEGFSHVSVFYWFDQLDIPEMRTILDVEKPYKNSPEVLGIFATRSPVRPNLIAHSVAGVVAIDQEKGRIQVDYLDAENDSPLLDVKPYTPSADRVEKTEVPEWCKHWPKNVETSGDFPWEEEFNF